MDVKNGTKTATKHGLKAVFTNPTALIWILVGVILYVTVVAGMGAAKGLSQTLAQLPKYCGNIPTDVADAWDNFTDWLNGTDDCEACAGTTGSTTVDGSSGSMAGDKVDNPLLKRAFTGLLAPPFSFTPEQAAGVIGNLAVESSGSPTVVSSLGYFGIAQWGGGRRTKVEKWIRDHGKGDILDKGSGASDSEKMELMAVEMGYIWQELKTDYKTTALAGVRGAKTVNDAERAWVQYYEVAYVGSPNSGVWQAESDRRQYAAKAFALYKDLPAEQLVQEEDDTNQAGTAGGADSGSSGGCSDAIANPGQPGDDYPWKGMGYTSPNPYTSYYYGNCTDFVFWRINRDRGVTSGPPWNWVKTYSDLTPNGGNGKQWGQANNMPGWDFVNAGDAPKVGDVVSIINPPQAAWGSSSPIYGHVAYIGAVNDDGSFLLEAYGHGKYFAMTKTQADMTNGISSGAIAVRRDPSFGG